MKHKTKSWGLIGCNSLIQFAFKTLLLIVLIIGVSLSAQGQIFSTPKNISNNPGISWAPQIAVDDEGNIYAAWMDMTPGRYDIFFSRSTDGGRTFSNPLNISNDNTSSYDPRITVDGHENIYVVWWGGGRIRFSYSSNNGETFSPPIVLHTPLYASRAELAVDSRGNINVVFHAGLHPDRYIYFCRSTDNGGTFSSPLNLSPDQIDSAFPKITVDSNGKIYIVWHEWGGAGYPNDSFFTCSSEGVTFSIPINLSGDLYNWAGAPEIAVDSAGNINIVWRNDAVPCDDIFFRRSTDGGISFSTPVNISNSPNASSGYSQIDVDYQGNINVVWWEGVSGALEIFFSRSTEGIYFSTPVNISNTLANSQEQKIAVDNQGNINIIWRERAPEGGVFFSRSTDGGLNFHEPKSLDVEGGAYPQIALDSTRNVYIIYPKISDIYSDIYIVRSLDSLFQNLIDLIGEINLKQGITNSLDAKLDVALRALEDANENNNVAAVQALESFIIQVAHQRGGQITNEDADALIAAAQNILDMLY